MKLANSLFGRVVIALLLGIGIGMGRQILAGVCSRWARDLSN
jgi:hypothetical protein